jgi:tRNA1(Val) A37 N6-methylase TrmN6
MINPAAPIPNPSPVPPSASDPGAFRSPADAAATGPDPAPPGDPDAVDAHRLLDGALTVLQPRRGGHRAGLDALLLAAAVPAEATGLLADFGAGVGVAGLAALVRAPGLSAVLVERDAATAALARRGLDLPENSALAARARVVVADVTARAAAREAAGLVAGAADWVIMNPPFHPADASRASPSAVRRAAHLAGRGDLERWLAAAAWALKPDGRLALVYRADGLAEILAAAAGRFGGLVLHPIHPRAADAAHRLVVTGRRGSRAAPRLAPGLVLHPDGGNLHLPAADAILRGRAGLVPPS